MVRLRVSMVYGFRVIVSLYLGYYCYGYGCGYGCGYIIQSYVNCDDYNKGYIRKGWMKEKELPKAADDMEMS